MLDRLLEVEPARVRVADTVEHLDIVAPGQLCSSLLHKFSIGVGLGEAPHIFEVSRREPFHFRKLSPQVRRQAINHLGAPALARLAGEDVSPNRPVELHELAIDRDHGREARRSDPRLQIRKQDGVVDRNGVAMWSRCIVARFRITRLAHRLHGSLLPTPTAATPGEPQHRHRPDVVSARAANRSPRVGIGKLAKCLATNAA